MGEVGALVVRAHLLAEQTALLRLGAVEVHATALPALGLAAKCE